MKGWRWVPSATTEEAVILKLGRIDGRVRLEESHRWIG